MNLPHEISIAKARGQQDTDSGLCCNICFKSFTTQSTKNRHVLYCRKKSGNNISALKKSCTMCRKAKVKCNSETPQCRRCIEKSVFCVYELTRRSEKLSQLPISPPMTEPRHDADIFVENPDLLGADEIVWDLSQSCSKPDPPNSNVDHIPNLTAAPYVLERDFVFDWEPGVGITEDVDESGVGNSLNSNSSANDTSFDWFLQAPTPSLSFSTTAAIPADCMFHTPYLVLRPMDFDYPSRFNSVTLPRSPFIQSYPSPGSQIGRTFLMESIQSYATSLATHTLPPFIHSSSLPVYGPILASSAPLEICKSITSLYVVKTAATSPFIWRTITMEKDRFLRELDGADEETTLSMLQAITLYIILRISDQDSFSVDFDRELVRIMTKIAIKAEQCQLICKAEVEGWCPDWQEWLLVESKRRTVTLLFILHLLFDIKPEQRSKSHVGLSVLPLPAQKQLWQAVNEEDWRRDYTKSLMARKGEGYLTYKDLKDLGNGAVSEQRMRDLKLWMVNGDVFGMLVMMAATVL